MLIMIPEVTNTQEYKDFLDDIKECIGQDTIPIYTKIVGGLKCSTIEQQKMSLAINLMRKIGLECLDSTGVDPNMTYLQSFVAFSQKHCRECTYMSTVAGQQEPASVVPGLPTTALLFESGNNILLETVLETEDYLILEA
jgi:hypothetical protein